MSARISVVFSHRDTDRCELRPSILLYTTCSHSGMLKRRNRLLHLPLPHWLSVHLEWYWNTIRPLLNAKAEDVDKYMENCVREIAEHNRLCPQSLLVPLLRPRPNPPCAPPTHIYTNTHTHTHTCICTHRSMMFISSINITEINGFHPSSR
jgi:hypothetical protein